MRRREVLLIAGGAIVGLQRAAGSRAADGSPGQRHRQCLIHRGAAPAGVELAMTSLRTSVLRPTIPETMLDRADKVIE